MLKNSTETNQNPCNCSDISCLIGKISRKEFESEVLILACRYFNYLK